MDIAKLSNLLLNIFYIMIGIMMIITMVYTLKDTNHKTRLGTATFWGILATIFIFGEFIPSIVVGGLIVIIGVLGAFNQINVGTIAQLNETFARVKAEKIGIKIFLPSLIIAFVALGIAQFTKLSGVTAIGISAVVAIIITFFITGAKPKEAIVDSDRMLQAIGSTAILPQLLASLGALFAAAGVGDIISNMISGVIPEGNVWIGITAYCVGMALFTAIMGNAFAAFTVITAGIGAPFVFAQGGDPIIASAIAMTAGFCGTLLTPMAANFNILPAVLLDIEDNNGVIKAQSIYAIVLLLIHIPLMYFLAF
ncbi:DUF979 domain-containing protein [Clostridium septicum]|uniref:DUF979 domain-containing protein n=1 Tax=Clostridium septicum TaxID=1504 RepID=A0A9N7JKF7_CLOSE|nr:DUF979 domain-containing protein [Clostridium septicum]AYE33517.1 DUF979 domain-containing protein [Clostridium septicum]MDU1313790.1 DUF979 domain-containing protein [Clostridium septicum]QAS61683.1 DUF979 domain-containing protein [Clostridium septicum]UEC21874.1 DUF979 domain-containing protein [Clostridium septicum]WLF68620.1 DUF979 domain-containing protein [Clostridium septicum]